MSDARNVKYLPGGGADITDIEVVEPGPGEIQVSKAACGICSWDLQTFRWGSDHRSAAPPGHEGVGHVTKVGEGVQGYEVGDRVVGGGFASVGNRRARSAYKIPPSNMADEHWVVEPVSCCVTGVDRCELKVGERMIMIGTGFMGLISLQILRGMGADQLICLDVDDKRLEMARELGATETYNTTAEGFDEVKRDLMSRRIDIVYDTTGAQAGLDIATELVRPGGRINVFGWLKGDTATFNPTAWHGKGITVINAGPAAQIRDPFPAAIRLMHNGIVDLKPLVTHTVPIEEFPQFMSKVTVGEVDGFIKGVVTYPQ